MASSFPGKPLLKLKKSSDNKAQIRKNELKGKKLNCSLGFSTVSLGAIRSSVGNIKIALDQVIHRLPNFYKSLSSEMQSLFTKLLETSMNNKIILTSKEARQARRAIRQDFENASIQDIEEVADLLVDIGVIQDVQIFLPMLQHEAGKNILQMAYKLTTLKLNANNISLATDKAAKVVFALKSYSHRDSSGEKTHANIVDGIETVLTIYHNQLKYGVEVIRNFEKEIPPMLCYPDELNQVWTNLIHNSLQAMDGKGTLTIDVKQETDKITVSITDSGKGIPPEIKDKIFEPFFTTKGIGEGSGLGLDIVRKIVEKHDGVIQVVSVAGEGATFSVSLPVEAAQLGN